MDSTARKAGTTGRSLLRLILIGAWVLLSHTPADAQGSGSSSITGTVVDADGRAVPGVTVVVTSSAKATSFTVATNGAGVFSVPAVDPGRYVVTVSKAGFKTAVVSDVLVTLGVPASVSATLQAGTVNETVEVRGGSELINTQTPTVSSTLDADQINAMPMPTRNLLNAVTFLPGVNTAGIIRESTFNGLPNSFVAISLDGVSDNDNYNKSIEGLFAMATPRQDAIEAVTVATAATGAGIGGHGAVQISFRTRSGSSRFDGSLYEYHRDPRLNTNYWFNKNSGLPKNDVVLNQYGFRQSGPVVLPGYDGRGKAFFFVNYEELRLPNDVTRMRIMMTPLTQQGWMHYNVTSGGVTRVEQVNVLDVAAANGQSTALDPTVSRLLDDIRNAAATTGTITQSPDPNLLIYTWQSPGNQVEKQPVVRVDYNINARHRLSNIYNWQMVLRDPDHVNSADVRFPGLQNYRRFISYRPLNSTTLRSALSPSMVNELTGGIRWGPSSLGDDRSNGPQTFQASGGYALDWGCSTPTECFGATNWYIENAPTSRSAWSWNVDDTLTWQRGAHNLSLGGELYFGNVWATGQQVVPSIRFGVAAADPASPMFTTANFPGASNATLTTARELYATLTGRVAQISGQLALDPNTNQYVFLGPRTRAGKMNQFALFAQDSWRTTPTLTLNGGVRWTVQLPFTPVNDTMSQTTYDDACGISGKAANGVCRFFQPGATGGKVPNFLQFSSGTPGYHTDWNNAAPNVGVAWRPSVRHGLLRAILGDPEQATLRAGYSIAYDRQGMAVFTDRYGANPGSVLSVTRNESNGLLVPAGESWPVFLSQTNRLALGADCPPGVVNAGCNPGSPTFPIAVRSGRADDLNLLHPDLKISFARTFEVGLQRSLSQDMAVEVRYVGTRGVSQWTTDNYNERNLIENGFFDEFKVAMSNLQAAIAQGCGGAGQPACSFAYRGPGSGTLPLPIYLAYFDGSKESNNAAAYAGPNWTNSTFVGRLSKLNPTPASAAADLDGDAGRRANALTAGLPANFFVLNPDVNAVNVQGSDGFSAYDALQVEVRRRLSHGLQINGSYQYAVEHGSTNQGLHYGRALDPAANVRHAIKMQWNYIVPVGRGQRFGANMNRLLDLALGGWQFDGTGRVQARVLDFGNIRLVGMAPDDVTREYYYRIVDDPNNAGRKIVKMMPDDIILNTRRAFSTSATTLSGYSDALGPPEGRYFAPANSATCIQLRIGGGDCAPRTLLIRAPFFTRFDMSLSKRFMFTKNANFELRFDALNVFDNVNFNPVASPGSSSSIFQVTSAYMDPTNTYDPGGRLGQIVVRLNW